MRTALINVYEAQSDKDIGWITVEKAVPCISSCGMDYYKVEGRWLPGYVDEHYSAVDGCVVLTDKAAEVSA